MFDEHDNALPLNEEVEVSEGVFVLRRTFLAHGLVSLGLAGVFPLLTTGKADAQDNALPQAPPGQISFAQFLSQANPLAKRLVEDSTVGGQDQYLHSLASLAARIDDVPEPASWNDSTQSFKPGTFIGFTPGGEIFTVLNWRMEPYTNIRLHRHDYGNVVTLGLGGEAHLENYEIVSDNHNYVPGKTIKVRKTIDQQLIAGNINLVSLDRNYIHGFTAGANGARGVDITTRIRPRPAHGTPYLAVRKRADDEIRRIYEAEWEE